MRRKDPYKIHNAMALVGKQVFVKLTKPWTSALAMNIGKLAHQTITLLYLTAVDTPSMNRPTIPNRFNSQLITSYTSNQHYSSNTARSEVRNLVIPS